MEKESKAALSALFKTPATDHLYRSPFKYNVYDPSEDSFLLLDALQADHASLWKQDPLINLEIGSGSGLIITFLGRILAHNPHHARSAGRRRPQSPLMLATDVNPLAAQSTRLTALQNQAPPVDVILSDLVSGLFERLQGKLDVIVFNPPYVPTLVDEIPAVKNDEGVGIEAAWAGGTDGRVVLDRLLPLIPRLLSPTGVLYLLLIEKNKPHEIQKQMSEHGLHSEVIVKRTAHNEHLLVVKFFRPPAQENEL